MSNFEPRNLTEGLNGVLGFKLIDWQKDFAQIEVKLDERHKNRQGGVHGGVIVTLIDAATGYCGVFEPEVNKRKGNVTVSLTTNFLNPVKTSTITCNARTIKSGKKLYFASAQVTVSDNNIIAKAEAVYAYVDRNAQRTK